MQGLQYIRLHQSSNTVKSGEDSGSTVVVLSVSMLASVVCREVIASKGATGWAGDGAGSPVRPSSPKCCVCVQQTEQHEQCEGGAVVGVCQRAARHDSDCAA